jgi:hypothetical protein
MDNHIPKNKFNSLSTKSDENSVLIPISTPNQLDYDNMEVTSSKIVSWALQIGLISVFPLILGDMYFSFKSISCQETPTKLNITLSNWLEVSSIITLFVCILIAGCFNKISKCKIIYMIFVAIYTGWAIFGMTLFWKYMPDTPKCSSDITIYMGIRTISSSIFSIIMMGFVWLG